LNATTIGELNMPKIHLLKTRGGNECGRQGASDPDINCVTCPDCLQAHENLEPVEAIVPAGTRVDIRAHNSARTGHGPSIERHHREHYMPRTYVVRYDADSELAYAGRYLARPGLNYLSPEAIGDTPHGFKTRRNAERAAIAHGMSCYAIKAQKDE
jgi:hypothetical protein